AVCAAAYADVPTDHAIGNDDRVIAEPGDEIAVDRAARHIEIVIVELHVDTANTATGHYRVIAIIERIDNSAARHEESIQRIALVERADLATRHLEVV